MLEKAVVDSIEQVLVALRRVIRATDLHSKYLVKTTGLTAPQLLVLQSIRRVEGITSGELAREVNLSQATITNILDRLENKGMVRRERSEEDKRRVNVFLTDDGLDALKDSPLPMQESFVREFRDLQDWEQTQIISALQRVATMMDAQHIDASPVLDVGELDRPEGVQKFERVGKN